MIENHEACPTYVYLCFFCCRTDGLTDKVSTNGCSLKTGIFTQQYQQSMLNVSLETKKNEATYPSIFEHKNSLDRQEI